MKIQKNKIFKYGIILFCCSTAYSILMVNVSSLFGLAISTFIKIAFNSLFIPVFGIIIFNLLPNKLFKVLFSLLYNLVYFTIILVCLIYFKYFQALPHINIVGKVDIIPNILRQIFMQLISGEEILIMILAVICTVGMMSLSPKEKEKRKKVLVALFIILLIFLFENVYLFYRNRPFSLGVMVRHEVTRAYAFYGFFPTLLVQIINEMNSDSIFASFPGKIHLDAKEDIPLLKDYNVILIQIESLDKWIIDYKINDQYPMKFLAEFQECSIVLDNFFAQHSGGGTSDCELSTMTSLLPLPKGGGLVNADFSRINGLPKVLLENGYTTIAIFPTRSSLFSRYSIYPRLGFQKIYSKEDFSSEAGGWYSRDIDLFSESINKLKDVSQPFFLYLITMQSHSPFTNHGKEFKGNLDVIKRNIVKDYIRVMSEVDRALEYFVQKLKELEIYNKTILIVFSDHQSGVKQTRLMNKEIIPAFIFFNGISHAHKTRLVSHYDIPPTVCHLLNIKEPYGWLGTSIFSHGQGGVLFNDLDYFFFKGDSLIKKRDESKKDYLNYSYSIQK